MSAENRRRFERHTVRRPIYAYTMDAMERVGLVKEIGFGGLCMDYVVLKGVRDGEKGRNPYGIIMVSVGEAEKECWGFPYRLVHVQHLPGASPWGGQHYRMERLGMAFGKLTDLQQSQINRLIGTFR